MSLSELEGITRNYVTTVLMTSMNFAGTGGLIGSIMGGNRIKPRWS